MDGNFSAAAVVGEVMSEAEGFFTEGLGKFLLLFNFLLVKDSAQFVQRVNESVFSNAKLYFPSMDECFCCAKFEHLSKKI